MKVNKSYCPFPNILCQFCGICIKVTNLTNVNTSILDTGNTKMLKAGFFVSGVQNLLILTHLKLQVFFGSILIYVFIEWVFSFIRSL